ncbi:c-type cytochrome biogenesis protein CcmI [Uliginosibacterium sp. 31-16]|uniref:c-type cytochrome biogenesis protein CcmI n=1 Tax=Uliginosibacterium sp. 31-16 TaxID=3068315 RepID=UPI00273EEF40|nr:c-type cytochrome biogenesis protein CcmI [Uliginosibacterium sp. 31-16]MDP5239200.1 c-type cytochrome biogenesis protein CcmI [Uliginosibacterium sp. 31-16]
MSPFLIAAGLLLLAVLAVLLWPLWRRPAALEIPAEAPALRILREQRATLDAELAAGQIDAAAHAEGLDELARRALAEADVAPAEQALAVPRRGWAIATGLASTLLAVGLYLALGNPAALDPALRVAPQGISPLQIEAMVDKLAAKVAANPDDLEGLHMLGRSYMVLERFKDASDTFAKLAQKQPANAQTFADWADALGSAGGSLTGEPAKLVARALQLDPANVKALALAGTIAFDAGDYKQAVSLWEKMAAHVDPQSDMAQSAQTMIGEARKRAGLPIASPAQPAAGSLSASGKITLAGKEMAAGISPETSLFVFARPAAGGPPLAALRFKVSDLPLDFDFRQATLMMAGAALPEKIIIGARISKSGNATPGPGDLQGFSPPVAPDAQGIKLVISEEIPR